MWFGIKGLVVAGKNFNNCSSIRKACDFLLSKQLSSGGWGESYLSCQNKVSSSKFYFLLALVKVYKIFLFCLFIILEDGKT